MRCLVVYASSRLILYGHPFPPGVRLGLEPAFRVPLSSRRKSGPGSFSASLPTAGVWVQGHVVSPIGRVSSSLPPAVLPFVFLDPCPPLDVPTISLYFEVFPCDARYHLWIWAFTALHVLLVFLFNGLFSTPHAQVIGFFPQHTLGGFFFPLFLQALRLQDLFDASPSGRFFFFFVCVF